MTEEQMQKAAESFVNLLQFVEEPELRCHPNLEQYAKKIAEAMFALRVYKTQKNVFVVADEFCPLDRIYAIDRRKMREPWTEIPRPDIPTPTRFEYDFSWKIVPSAGNA